MNKYLRSVYVFVEQCVRDYGLALVAAIPVTLLVSWYAPKSTTGDEIVCVSVAWILSAVACKRLVVWLVNVYASKRGLQRPGGGKITVWDVAMAILFALVLGSLIAVPAWAFLTWVVPIPWAAKGSLRIGRLALWSFWQLVPACTLFWLLYRIPEHLRNRTKQALVDRIIIPAGRVHSSTYNSEHLFEHQH